jgi:hypothetical protein
MVGPERINRSMDRRGVQLAAPSIQWLALHRGPSTTTTLTRRGRRSHAHGSAPGSAPGLRPGIRSFVLFGSSDQRPGLQGPDGGGRQDCSAGVFAPGRQLFCLHTAEADEKAVCEGSNSRIARKLQLAAMHDA